MSSRKTLDYDCKTRFTETEYAAIKQAAAWQAKALKLLGQSGPDGDE